MKVKSRASQVERGATRVTGAVLIVLSAPSGGGKTTVCQQLLAMRPNLARAITCTTRPPRAGEREGVDYYFLDTVAFFQRVQAGEFLEHATVFGNFYGTLKSEVLDKLQQGRDVILSVDVQGMASIRGAAAADPGLQRALVTVFLAPPSLAELAQRLRHRGLDSAAVIEQRLSMARHEIAQAKDFDYVVISSTIPDNVRRMETILEAEKMRPGRVVLPEYE